MDNDEVCSWDDPYSLFAGAQPTEECVPIERGVLCGEHRTSLIGPPHVAIAGTVAIVGMRSRTLPDPIAREQLLTVPATVLQIQLAKPREVSSGDPKGVRRMQGLRDRKSTRLNSSHGYISYAVFCLKKK